MTNKEQGFTIIELLISMIVTVILVTGINIIYTVHLTQTQRVRSLAVINSYVENKVESLRSAGFLSINDGTFNISNELPSELKIPKSASLVISSPASGVKKCVITVTYNDAGSEKTFNYTTFIGELGVGQY
jgi:prepilin-type N-terminal cleavage/methylation domain-containing protein